MLMLTAMAHAWEVLGPAGAPTGRTIEAATLFRAEPAPWEGATVPTDPAALATAAAAALAWFDAHPEDPATGPALFGELGVDRARVRQTLARIAQIAAEDALSGAARLTDPDFLQHCFEVYRWYPDRDAASARKVTLAEGELRLTRYFVPVVEGRAERAAPYTVALYADPGPAWDHLTRMQVFEGAFEAGGIAAGAATPLAWLREADAHDALMQGSISVHRADGTDLLLNVDRPNRYAYKPGADGRHQDRLWYFKAVDSLRGWGDATGKLALTPTVSVAGDPWNLGIGKVVALWSTAEAGTTVRLAVVGDTGGAFQPNLFQLDLLAGVFADRAALYAATREIPDRVSAAVLLLRTPTVP